MNEFFPDLLLHLTKILIYLSKRLDALLEILLQKSTVEVFLKSLETETKANDQKPITTSAATAAVKCKKSVILYDTEH